MLAVAVGVCGAFRFCAEYYLSDEPCRPLRMNPGFNRETSCTERIAINLPEVTWIYYFWAPMQPINSQNAPYYN
jgi:hypothetical protein